MDLNVVKQLIEMMKQAGLTVMEIETVGLRLRMEKGYGVAEKPAPVYNETINVIDLADTSPVAQEVDNANVKYITSPVVGAYHSLKSLGKGELTVGSSIKKGQVVCAVEAMKLMNEVESEFAGEVMEILVSDGDVVEFGQKIVKLKCD